VGEQLARLRQEPPARVGQREPARAPADEQLRTDRLLQRRDGERHGRLRQAQPLGRGGHRPGLGRGDERLELAEVQHAPCIMSELDLRRAGWRCYWTGTAFHAPPS
jgi:hypothetical protein